MQVAEHRDERPHLVAGVQAARTREYPDAGAFEALGLLAERRLWRGECEAIGAHAQESDDAGPVAPYLSLQPLSPIEELGRVEFVSACGGAGDQVGEAVPLFEEEILFPWPEPARREPAGMQRRPEAVAGAREMVASGGRVEAGIDAAEEDLQVRRDDVAQRLRASGLELLSGRLKLAG